MLLTNKKMLSFHFTVRVFFHKNRRTVQVSLPWPDRTASENFCVKVLFCNIYKRKSINGRGDISGYKIGPLKQKTAANSSDCLFYIKYLKRILKLKQINSTMKKFLKIGNQRANVAVGFVLRTFEKCSVLLRRDFLSKSEASENKPRYM